jgi:hypothetical protein
MFKLQINLIPALRLHVDHTGAAKIPTFPKIKMVLTVVHVDPANSGAAQTESHQKLQMDVPFLHPAIHHNMDVVQMEPR